MKEIGAKPAHVKTVCGHSVLQLSHVTLQQSEANASTASAAEAEEATDGLRSARKQRSTVRETQSCSGHPRQACKSGSGISRPVLASGLQLPVCVFSQCVFKTGIECVHFFPFKLLVLLHSASSLNIWKMAIKFLGTTVVLLIVQRWKDAAAS